MTREPVTSSDIATIGYDEAILILEVEFRSGGLYQYSGVPRQIFEGMKAAPSVGRYFHQNVKNKYPMSKIH